jgi:hypothetical protein
MSIVIVSIALVATAGRGAWLLRRLWRSLPRSNRDFDLF